MNTGDFWSYPFIAGLKPTKSEPLSRFMPHLPDGIVTRWLTENTPQGSWVIDPFCASPKIALEAAQLGYRVLVTVNNPVTKFILERLAIPQRTEDMECALSILSSSYSGSERLEPHIQDLYQTTCAQCGQSISADAFLWDQGNLAPSMRIYTCSNCGDSGEHPCNAEDVEKANRFSASGLHRARALERVIASSDPDRVHVEQALCVYIPRALYGLITIINKIDALELSTKERQDLSALLLLAFDQANAMWKVSGQKEKPRQLSIPHNYRENNIWKALEDAIKLWGQFQDNRPVQVSTWPDVPPASGGICLYEGRFATIVDEIKGIEVASVCAALPRPNQAFWTLSALWAGWLWGRESIHHFKSVLHRQRYDWSWHFTALSSVFMPLVSSLKRSTPIFGLISDAEPGFVASALFSACLAGCHLENFADRPEEEQVEVIWKIASKPGLNLASTQVLQAAIHSTKRYLEQRGEPAGYQNALSAGLSGVVREWETQSHSHPNKDIPAFDSENVQGVSSVVTELSPSSSFASWYNAAREALAFRYGFVRFSLQDAANVDLAEKNQISQSPLFSIDNQPVRDENSETEISEAQEVDSRLPVDKEKSARSSDIPVSTMIWLRDIEINKVIPISDLIEESIVDYLVKNSGCTLTDIDRHICQSFPGLFTPSLEFIRTCILSYAIPTSTDSSCWVLRREDFPDERQKDISSGKEILKKLGVQLGFVIQESKTNENENDVSWLDEVANTGYRFCFTPTAAISASVLNGDLSPLKRYIIIPGSRANIIFYKLRRDPRLGKALDSLSGSWPFIKFRHLRSLADSPQINRKNLGQLLSLDPLTYSTPQLWLI